MTSRTMSEMKTRARSRENAVSALSGHILAVLDSSSLDIVSERWLATLEVLERLFEPERCVGQIKRRNKRLEMQRVLAKSTVNNTSGGEQ